MLRAMYSGISGLRVHKTKLDVIGNNIANVNTVGFKASRVVFQEIYNQTLKSASAPSGSRDRGGTNPQQVGLGVSVASIDVLHTSTGVQRTDKATDLAIEGDGFFVVSDGVSNFYTRAGNFDIDAEGYLVNSSGLKVQGWIERDKDGNIEPSGRVTDINLAGLSMKPNPTSEILFLGNLDSTVEPGGTVQYTTTIVDSLGEEHNILLNFERNELAVMSEEITDVTDLDGKIIEITNGDNSYQFEINIPNDPNDPNYVEVNSLNDLVDKILNPALESDGALYGSGIKEFQVEDDSIKIIFDSPNVIMEGTILDNDLFDTRVEMTTNSIEDLDFSDGNEKTITITDEDGDEIAEIELDEEFESLDELKEFIQEELDDSDADITVKIDGDKLKFTSDDYFEIDDGDEWVDSSIEPKEYVDMPDPNVWNLTVTPAEGDSKIDSPSVLYKGTIRFDEDGVIDPGDTEITLADIEFNNGAKDSEDIVIRFDEEKTTQHDRESNIQAIENDGYGPGTLESISIDSAGRIIGIYSNGQVRVDGLLGIAKFNNPAGLTKLGNNLFQVSANSGDVEIDAAGVNGRGDINPGALEMSNVDLANEFTEMITAQRGFQANSRIITTSDEVLQELINLKR